MEPTPVTGWWAERHETFTLTLDPVIGVSASGLQQGQISFFVPIELGMDGEGRVKADLDLTVTPSLVMGAPHPTSVDFAITPSLDMVAGEHYGRDFGISVNPELGMSGDVSYHADLNLTVTPEISATVNEVHYAQNVDLTVTPELSMEPQGFSNSSFALSVDPALGMGATERYAKQLPLEVTPSVGMAAAEHYSRLVTVGVTPNIGMTGVGIAPPPEVAFNAVGAGNSQGTSGIAYNYSWNHTATGEGRAVVVSVSAQVAFGNIAGITVTYGGAPMTALTARGFNNTISAGFVQQFVLLDPPTGQQTVQVAVTHGGGFHLSYSSGNSVSYNNVATYTQAASSHGSGTTRSLTVTTATEGDMVAQAFGQVTASTSMSNYNQTQRGPVFGGNATIAALVLGDSDEGDNNIVFTATGNNTQWSGVSVVLHPA